MGQNVETAYHIKALYELFSIYNIVIITNLTAFGNYFGTILVIRFCNAICKVITIFWHDTLIRMHPTCCMLGAKIINIMLCYFTLLIYFNNRYTLRHINTVSTINTTANTMAKNSTHRYSLANIASSMVTIQHTMLSNIIIIICLTLLLTCCDCCSLRYWLFSRCWLSVIIIKVKVFCVQILAHCPRQTML